MAGIDLEKNKHTVCCPPTINYTPVFINSLDKELCMTDFSSCNEVSEMACHATDGPPPQMVPQIIHSNFSCHR